MQLFHKKRQATAHGLRMAAAVNNFNPRLESAFVLRSIPKAFAPGWIGTFLADVSSVMAYPLLPLFLVSIMDSSRTQLGAMEGGAAMIAVLMSALAGISSDRKGSGGGRVVWIRRGYGLCFRFLSAF